MRVEWLRDDFQGSRGEGRSNYGRFEVHPDDLHEQTAVIVHAKSVTCIVPRDAATYMHMCSINSAFVNVFVGAGRLRKGVNRSSSVPAASECHDQKRIGG